MSMSSSEGSDEFGSPRSQFSFPATFSEELSDDEIVWARDGSDGSNSEGDFILLSHPPPDACSLPPDSIGHSESAGDLSSTFDEPTSSDHDHITESSSSSGKLDTNIADLKKKGCNAQPRRERAACNARRPAQAQSVISSDSSGYRSGTSTSIASYDDASAFISRYLESPVKENVTQLALLRALIIELGVRSPTTPDLPNTLTSARKMLKAEAHVNVKEYIATRHKGQTALRQILKPSKKALRKDIQKRGNRASLQWVKEQGLQVLLITCFI
ncbi:hypothetical protein BS17DRAFT_726485 [Gyrodon lividus]|nr:hypothetical protein BS17DRAFT_726485 [Gyrodon lividus]